MSTPPCSACTRPSPHATICTECVAGLRVTLARIPDLFADLAVVAGKRTRYGDPIGGGRTVGKTQPLPVDGRFADPLGDGSRIRSDTRNTVTTWARVVSEEITGGDLPADTIAACCEYIDVHLSRAAGQLWAGELHDELSHVRRTLERFVDRPADRWYAGLCGYVSEPERAHDGDTCGCACHVGPSYVCDVPGGCGLEYATTAAVVCERPLWAKPGQHEIRCSDCGSTWDVAERRSYLLTEAEDRLATIPEIVRTVATLADLGLDTGRTEKRVQKWAERGLITARDVRPLGEVAMVKLYRFGDVYGMLRDRTTG